MKKMLIIILIVILLALLALTLWLPSVIMTGQRQTLEEAFAWQSDHYDTSFYDELAKTDYTVCGKDGYELHVQLLENPVPSTEYVILTHGITDNRMGSLKYVPTYLGLGFNCIIYDLRGHGENEPTFTTYGIREAEDLECLISDTRERYRDLTVLGLHGESLGAATTVTVLKYKPFVDFAVADCGFSDIENVLKGGYRSMHISADLMMTLADIGARIRYHYSLKAARPIDSLDDNEIPVLFIHGEEDELISPENSEVMAQRTRGRTEVHLIPGAGHAASVLTDPEAYAEIVRNFVKND